MSVRQQNSMAAVLSMLMQVIIWVAVVAGIIAFLLIGAGLIGSLNGGAVKVPGMETYVEDVKPGQFVAGLAGLVVFAPGIIYVCMQLKAILSTLAEGDPFVPENGPRLTRIAVAIGAVELARYVTVILLNAFVDLGSDQPVRLSINLAAWAAVVALFILAQVFREGSRLREEEKMTI
ncbi:hypothetical protein GCM10011503_29660 [Henriciella pelagia]|jgi:hypothetical protein|uniref:DUF2975 domain-containing protein n=2 Tax=Henriciella pelagia TaxID=1977912 RepID=A0ABQ1JYX8_9PROT|nr:hypothetical protein GCM10011503_29660 [Henriciella pelagia]